MEEKAATSGQMKPQNNEKRVSYEDLKNIAIELQKQNKELIARNNELAEYINNINTIEKRMYYLFEVLKYANMFNEDFIKKSVQEIENLLTLPEQSEQPDSNEEVK